MNATERRATMAKITKVLEHFDVRQNHKRLFTEAESPRRRWLNTLSAFIADRHWRKVTDWNMDSDLPGEIGEDSPPVADLREANIVTSEGKTSLGNEFHLPTLDIDIPVIMVPSTTHGHHHLMFNVACSREEYWNLLDALAACGIVQAAWVDASKKRGYSAIRMPWIKKEEITE